ncbi:MAG: HNH endonuclease [bacterium]|nr:HNH endonuclease [bacterium]
MISIERLPEPAILTKKKEKWLAAYLAKRPANPRPPSSQYGHRDIRDTLGAMSFNKCFYCECKLGTAKDERGEIDHYIEVEEEPRLAFDWDNLYLSCHDCNSKKLPNTSIPVSDCLDPCDLSEDTSAHLTFNDECIRPRNGSQKGAGTIQKYSLDRDELDHLRVKQIKNFERLLRGLLERQIQDGRDSLAPQEKEAIESFKEPCHAFSLMFRVYLTNVNL